MGAVVRRVVVVLGAGLGAILGAVPVFILSLILPWALVLPLMTGASAVFATLGASWACNLVDPLGNRTLIPSVLTFTAAVALVTLVVSFILALWAMTWPDSAPPAIFFVLPLTIVLPTVAASYAARRYRRLERSTARDALLSLGLLLLTLLGVVAALAISNLIGTVGL